jgi:transcriptional regulator with XRE-family HTH domain
MIGDRLRQIREEKKLSQGDIEHKTGLLRSYISRVENGHTVPSIETIEKFARALEIPMYQLFYDGEEPPKIPTFAKRQAARENAREGSTEDARLFAKLHRMFSALKEADQGLVFFMVQKMMKRKSPQTD